MTSPRTHPAERETPAGEALARLPEATYDDLARACRQTELDNRRLASELARLTAERDKLQRAVDAYRSPPRLYTLADMQGSIDRADAAEERASAAEAALTTLRADHAAEVARLKAQTPFVVTNGERGEDERFRMWSGRAWVWVNSIAYAALFVRKRDASQILPDGDPHDYPDRIRALTLKEAGHE